MGSQYAIAYFSMEIALEQGMPTYSGGLGVLAGDTIRAAADLKVPMVALTLLYRKGHFYQRLDASGSQAEYPAEWVVEDFLEEVPARASVVLEGRTVHIRAWKYEVTGVGGYRVPVYFLDTDHPENAQPDRSLTHLLYGGDERYRFSQEVVLGVGGVRMLRALGCTGIERFHMNEGHASLLALELLDEHARAAGRARISRDDIDAVRETCIFTTHTPVPAGHDQFPLDLVYGVIGKREAFVEMEDVFCCDGLLNMTYLALNVSGYVNGVAKKHGEVSRLMFAGYTIDSITNGVHAATWASEAFQKLYDHYVPGWRQDSFNLRYALSIPGEEVWQAHVQAKKRLVHYVNRETNAGMDVHLLTIGFARRAAPYKRGDLLFDDVGRLKRILAGAGRFQVVYAGKAHPRDQGGKDVIRRICQAREALKSDLKISYLENYDVELAKMLAAGVDVWLNTPQPPLEASGTSGMKAAINGVPSLSVLDGWWVEGHIEGLTGWAVGEPAGQAEAADRRSKDASALYDKLEQVVIPLFYGARDGFIEVMRHAMALNGSFFNTHRMMQQYVLKAYF